MLGAADETPLASVPQAAASEYSTYSLPTGAYPVVQTNPNSERLTHAVSILMLAYTTLYIAWRWLFTLNPDAMMFSVALALAETYGLVTAFFMTYTTWNLKKRVAPPAPRGLTVDVFVTTYDEPLNVIRKTALAAREIRYPHTTYILDDGKRDEFRGLAEDLGIEYLRRPDNRHAKAGNLNHALANSTGEFILQLDADHVPQPHILDRLLGFFADERVALAQSPQDFYNTDAFTYDVNETARRIWEDQQLFFRIIQPGKDARDAAFFVGSCAVLRRAALQDVGGFATTTITEDIETSLLLHSKGWRSVFYGETLAYGLAPGSAAAFHTQHLRWGQGAMQALRRYQPLSMRGLTMAQRIGYFDSLTTYFSGFQRLIFYLAPAVFFFTGKFPVHAGALQFFMIFAPYIALQFLAFKLQSRGHGSLLLADRYGMAKFFTHLVAVTAYFSRGALKFRVTPKGVTDVPFRTYAPQLVLACITALAVLWGVCAASFHLTSYTVPGWGSLAFYVNLLFAGWTFYSAMYIVDMSARLKTQRQDHRYADSMPVEIKVLREGRHVRNTLLGVTNDLNPNGLSFRSPEQVEDGAWVEMRLPLLTRPVDVKGRVVHRSVTQTNHGEVFNHGVEFVALSWEVRDAIELHCAHYTTPLRRQRYVQAFSAVGDALRWVRDPRRSRRAPVGMPVEVELRSGTNWAKMGLGLWEDVSETGARLLLGEALDIGDHVRAKVRATGLQFDGDVVFVRALETSLGARFVIGLRRPRTQLTSQVSPQQRGTPVNWNKFDRLLNRTRTDANAPAASAGLRNGAANGASNGTAAAAAAAGSAAIAAGGAAANGVANTAAAIAAASSAAHVEVLRPKVNPHSIAAADEPARISAEVASGSIAAEAEVEAEAADGDANAYTSSGDAADLQDAQPQYAQDELAQEDGIAPVYGEELAVEYVDDATYAETQQFEAPADESEYAADTQYGREENLPRWMEGVEEFKRKLATRDNLAARQNATRDSSARDDIAARLSTSPIDDVPVAPITASYVERSDGRTTEAPTSHTNDVVPTEPAHETDTTPTYMEVAPSYQDYSHTNTDTGADEMMTEQIMQSPHATQFSPPTETSMLTVWGGGARLDGKFEIDDSIEVRCELSGEVSVGGRLVIEEGGVVNATVRTVDAEIRGTFNGDLIATGGVHITETGRVTGNIQTEELVIARGGFFNGNVTRPEESANAAPGRAQNQNQNRQSGNRNSAPQRSNGASRRPGAANGTAHSHGDEQDTLRPRLRSPEEPGIAG
jgi:cellulose synthase (UDP-forming)